MKRIFNFILTLSLLLLANGAAKAQERRLEFIKDGRVVRVLYTSDFDYVTVKDGIDSYVDLGLSVCWATCNLGAATPEGYGNYYAWGETEPKKEYTKENSKWYGVKLEDMISQGVVDENGNLTAKYDAATANLGEKWRMPTWEDFQELKEKCTWEWTSQNDVNGMKMTGPNGNSIFLPATGWSNGNSLDYPGSTGYYWASNAVYSEDNGAKEFFFR